MNTQISISKKWIMFLCAAIACLAFAGCSYSPIVTEDALSYNSAVALSTSQMLLLNIVRASKRQPTFYTRLEGNTETTGLSTTDTLALPLSLTTAFSSPSSKAGSYASVTRTLSGLAASIGLGAADSSSLNLQTLDDRKYQFGMMSDLDTGTIRLYWLEGLQKDLLLLLFVGSVDMPHSVLRQLQYKFASCDQNEVSDRQIFCKAYHRGLSGLVPVADGAHAVDPAITSLESICELKKQDNVVFINDPAIDGPIGQNRSYCFNQLVRGLLAIGIDMDDAKNPKTIEAHVPSRIFDDGRIRTEILKEGLEIKYSSNPAFASLCKKPDGGAIFTLDEGDFATIKAGAMHDRQDPLDVSANSDGACTDAAASNPGRPERKHKEPADKKPSDVPDIASLQIDVNVRSFEGLIYYLGEIVRAESDATAPVGVPVQGRDGTYQEQMFVALKDKESANDALQVSTAGSSYSIPDGCADIGVGGAGSPAGGVQEPRISISGCSDENPTHETAQVLTMINQVWGLQKEATSSPSNPGVVISAPAP